MLQHAENGILVAENSTFEKQSDGDFFSCLVLPGVWIVSNHHLKRNGPHVDIKRQDLNSASEIETQTAPEKKSFEYFRMSMNIN